MKKAIGVGNQSSPPYDNKISPGILTFLGRGETTTLAPDIRKADRSGISGPQKARRPMILFPVESIRPIAAPLDISTLAVS